MGAPRSAVILLVEDNRDDIFFMKQALKKAGVRFPIRVVCDGEEAVAYLDGVDRFADRQKYPVPCIVLLDLKLPKRNGLEVLRWLRTHPEHADLPVLMITSSDEPKDRQEASDQGVEAYRVKPVSFIDLVRLAHEIRDKAEVHCDSAEPCPTDPGDGGEAA